MRRVMLVWLLPLCPAASLWATQPPPPGRERQDIEELISQLGDTNFRKREEAARRLLERDDAVPALRKAAAESRDPEIVRAAKQILADRAALESDRALARLTELAKNGEVDQAIELLVRRPKWDDEAAAWQTMTRLAERLIQLGQKEFGGESVPPTNQYFPAGDFRRYMEKVQPTILTKRKVTVEDIGVKSAGFVIKEQDITVSTAAISSYGLFASAGDIRAEVLSQSIVFAGGNVKINQLCTHCLIVCDGNLTADARDCLIIARGNVDCGLGQGCRIIASGTVSFNKKADGVKVKEKEPNPLGFVKFFDPAKAGVTVEEISGRLRVKEVADGKPFAKAGLKPGDVILTLGGEEVKAQESFRHLLRAKLAEGDEIAFKVRRGEKLVEIPVRCSQSPTNEKK